MFAPGCAAKVARDESAFRMPGAALACASALLVSGLILTSANPSGAAEKDYPLSIDVPIALAQTTVDGTVMSFGCDYEFKAGTRKPKARYVAILKNGQGKTVVAPVELEERGTAAAFVAPWRPGDKPFRGFFAEQVERTDRPGKPDYKPISAEVEFELNPNQE